MVVSMGLVVAVFFGLLFLIVGVIFYLRSVKEPKWNEYPANFVAPDMSLDKKRKRRMKVACTGSRRPKTRPATHPRKGD